MGMHCITYILVKNQGQSHGVKKTFKVIHMDGFFYSIISLGHINMIKIAEKEKEITIDGHACYAPKGHDIVCAGVSTLTVLF